MKNLFVKPSNPALTKVAREIPKSQINSYEIKKIVEQMLEVARGQRKNKKRPVMVGLAAPQIGILKRIILVDVKADGKGKVGNLRVYINPQIIWTSRKKGAWYEGCFSTGKVCGIVLRPLTISIRAHILRFMPIQPPVLNTLEPPVGKAGVIEEKWSGYVARIFQHEIDHLNGKRFPDLITNPDNLHWVKKSEFPLYRDKGTWRNWPKKCSFEKWESIKNH